MIVYIIDSQGFFIGNNTIVVSVEQGLAFVEQPINNNFVRNKWNGSDWIEGATTEEIEFVNNELVSKRKSEANELLKETDWYVIRFQETGKKIPQEILDLRQQIRDNV